MSDVDCLADLPAWKAEKTTQRGGDNCHYRTDPRGTALHHYADLGAQESMIERIEQEVDEELARLNDNAGGDE